MQRPRAFPELNLMRIGLGITGGISAYKSVEVLRGLQKSGAVVQVVMSRSAEQFIGPLTFQSLSGLPVITDMFAPSDDPEIKHIAVAQSIDLLLVAPATANILAKFATGIADDFLSTLYISCTAPVLVAPAMNNEMWAHPATRENVRRLRERGVHFIDPSEGYLACKSVGPGRLAEPEDIVRRALEIAAPAFRSGEQPFAPEPRHDLAGVAVLVTAGPTYEAIDPVRGITNRSSGKMGYAVAEAARDRGAQVTLVSGPVALKPLAGVNTLNVRSAAQMRDAVLENLASTSIIVMAAAVADYRPARPAPQKIKKDGAPLVLELEPTEDILATVARAKGECFVVGFAAETEDLVPNARKKLVQKGADLIVANNVSCADAGFDVDTNRITLVLPEKTIELPLLTKRQSADRILDLAVETRRA